MGHQGDWQVAVNNHSQMNNLGKVARDTRNQGWQVGAAGMDHRHPELPIQCGMESKTAEQVRSFKLFWSGHWQLSKS